MTSLPPNKRDEECADCGESGKAYMKTGLCGRCYKNSNSHWHSSSKDYSPIHHWIKEEYGNTGNCEFCGDDKTQWANKSGDYKKSIDDWMRLCIACHRLYDNYGGRHEVIQYDKSGIEVGRYPSAKSASEATGLSAACISNSIRSERRQSYAGFKWTYEPYAALQKEAQNNLTSKGGDDE